MTTPTVSQRTSQHSGRRLDATELAFIRERVRGDVIHPGHDAYVAARRIWNGAIDRRPAVIRISSAVAGRGRSGRRCYSPARLNGLWPLVAAATEWLGRPCATTASSSTAVS